MIFKSDQRVAELNGFLDSGSRMEGELRFDASFRVDGKMVGKVVSDGTLVVGEGGEIDGEVRVGEIFVSGTIRGDVYARRKIHLAPNSRALANLHTPALIVEDGALFDGSCSMMGEDGASGERPVQLIKPLPAPQKR